MITLYHNSKCGTSRNVLEMLRERGYEPRVIEYLKTPLNAHDIKALVKRMKLSVREVLREKEAVYNELALSDAKWSDEQLIGFIVQHPILLNRPIVDTGKQAKLCRPAETVLALLATLDAA
jgi:arsenate reductase